MVAQGVWSAQVHPDVANAAFGSWAIVDGGNRVILQGTWTAERSAVAWRGGWSARIATGQTLSGTWEAALDDRADNGDGVMDLLKLSLQQAVAGSWRYGGLTGSWSVRASPE
jgi:hypothetical protein